MDLLTVAYCAVFGGLEDPAGTIEDVPAGLFLVWRAGEGRGITEGALRCWGGPRSDMCWVVGEDFVDFVEVVGEVLAGLFLVLSVGGGRGITEGALRCWVGPRSDNITMSLPLLFSQSLLEFSTHLLDSSMSWSSFDCK